MKKKLLLSAVALAISIGYASAADYVARELDGHFIRITNNVTPSLHIGCSGDQLVTTTNSNNAVWYAEYDSTEDGVIFSQNGKYMGCIPATVGGNAERDVVVTDSKEHAGRYRLYSFDNGGTVCLTTTKLDNGEENTNIGVNGAVGDNGGFWLFGFTLEAPIKRYGSWNNQSHWTYSLLAVEMQVEVTIGSEGTGSMYKNGNPASTGWNPQWRSHTNSETPTPGVTITVTNNAGNMSVSSISSTNIGIAPGTSGGCTYLISTDDPSWYVSNVEFDYVAQSDSPVVIVDDVEYTASSVVQHFSMTRTYGQEASFDMSTKSEGANNKMINTSNFVVTLRKVTKQDFTNVLLSQVTMMKELYSQYADIWDASVIDGVLAEFSTANFPDWITPETTAIYNVDKAIKAVNATADGKTVQLRNMLHDDRYMSIGTGVDGDLVLHTTNNKADIQTIWTLIYDSETNGFRFSNSLMDEMEIGHIVPHETVIPMAVAGAGHIYEIHPIHVKYNADNVYYNEYIVDIWDRTNNTYQYLHCGKESINQVPAGGRRVVKWNSALTKAAASAWFIELTADEALSAAYHNAFNGLRKRYYPASIQETFANADATTQELKDAWAEVLKYNAEHAGAMGAPDEKPALVTRYRQITSVDEIKDGMQIIVRHVDNQANGSDLYFTQSTHTYNGVEKDVTFFYRPGQIEDVNSIIWNVEFDETHSHEGCSHAFYLKSANGKYFNAQHTNNSFLYDYCVYEGNVKNYVLGTYLLDSPEANGRSALAVSLPTSGNSQNNATNHLADCGQVFIIWANTTSASATDFGTKLGVTYLSRDGGLGKLCAGTSGAYYTDHATDGAYTSYFVLYAVEHEQAYYEEQIAPAVALQYYTIGDNPGQISSPIGNETTISNVITNYNTYNESALLDALYAFKSATEGIDVANPATNPMDTDRYIRIIGNTATPHYLTAPSSGNNNFSVDYTDNAIFFYGGRRLLSYTQGAALKSTDVNGGFLRNRTTVDEHEVENPGSVIDIVAAPASDDNPIQTTGRFFVYFEDQHRTMFNGEGSNGRGGVYDPNSIDGAGKQTTTNGGNKYYAFKIEYVNELPVQIHSDGIGSLYCGMNVRVPEEAGYIVYVASINEYTDTEGYQQQDLVTTIANAGTVIPAYTPILIQGEASTTVQVPVTADAANYNVTAHSKIKSHLLVKNATPDTDHVLVVKKEVAADAQTMNVRRRTGSEVTTPVQFHVVGEDETVPAGSVAIMVHQENNHLENGVFTASLGGSTGTTGIDEVVGKADAAATVVYDLLGRRLAAPVKGFNIINGKKVFVK